MANNINRQLALERWLLQPTSNIIITLGPNGRWSSHKRIASSDTWRNHTTLMQLVRRTRILPLYFVFYRLLLMPHDPNVPFVTRCFFLSMISVTSRYDRK
jgi:hypothetical protein